jgi:hypothetical protein
VSMEAFQLFGSWHPPLLYHVTRKRFLPSIRREGLKPHIPGKVWGVCSPDLTNGKRVVWLTADPTEWRHDKHREKSWRDPEARLLTVMVPWTDKRLQHYLSWIDANKKHFHNSNQGQNIFAWFTYLGRIISEQIVGGLESALKAAA